MLTYQDLLDIGLSPDAHALQARLVAAAAELGFGLSGGTLIRGRLSSGNAVVNGFGNPPDGFAEASRSLDMGLRDPYLTAMLSGAGCHTYDQAFYARAGAGDLWDLVAQFGYRSGMAVSLHEPSHLEMFSFGVDAPDALPTKPAHRLRLEADLTLLAMHAQQAARRLWTPRPLVDLNAITPPEANALQWAADAVVVRLTRGRVVIASPGRVELQRSAARKLGAKNRGEAVLRAIEGGLIDR
jgi:hypothetical protein